MNNQEMKSFLQRPLFVAPDVFVLKDPIPKLGEDFHQEDLLPSYLTQEPTPAPQVFRYWEQKRLYIPFVKDQGYALNKATAKVMAALSSLGTTCKRCHRCGNSGISQWRARGTVAVVCACVAKGLSLVGSNKCSHEGEKPLMDDDGDPRCPTCIVQKSIGEDLAKK